MALSPLEKAGDILRGAYHVVEVTQRARGKTKHK